MKKISHYVKAGVDRKPFVSFLFARQFSVFHGNGVQGNFSSNNLIAMSKLTEENIVNVMQSAAGRSIHCSAVPKSRGGENLTREIDNAFDK